MPRTCYNRCLRRITLNIKVTLIFCWIRRFGNKHGRDPDNIAVLVRWLGREQAQSATFGEVGAGLLPVRFTLLDYAQHSCGDTFDPFRGIDKNKRPKSMRVHVHCLKQL
jgi:hypothetical protein